MASADPSGVAAIALGPAAERESLAERARRSHISAMRSSPLSRDRQSSSRDSGIEVRLTSSRKALIRRAADLRGHTLSEFVHASAADAARETVRKHLTIRLTRQEQVAVVEGLLNPLATSARLQRAAEAHLHLTRHRTGRDAKR